MKIANGENVRVCLKPEGLCFMTTPPPLSFIHTCVCNGFLKCLSFLTMSHGQKSLKATALDTFSYAPEDMYKKAYCVVPQSWTTPSCPSDGET